MVTIDVFSDKENRCLVQATMSLKLSEEELALSANDARRVFGNLPLCVGIYLYLQAAYSRRHVDAEFHRLCKETFSFDKWKAMEREFGDRFHVRELTGILEIAEKIINREPLVLLLLAKISLCLTESVPWQVLVLNDLRRVVGIRDEFRELFYQLTKIADCLFSFQ